MKINIIFLTRLYLYISIERYKKTVSEHISFEVSIAVSRC